MARKRAAGGPKDPLLSIRGVSPEHLREEREAFFRRARRYTDYLSSPVGEGRLLVRTEDEHVGRALFAKQGRGDMKVLARSVLAASTLLGEQAIAGRTFIDVGANIGSTTVTALMSHPFADAVAIEPEPENFRTLRLNLVLNDLDSRVRAYPLAVSNVVGELDLVVDRAKSGNHWIAADEKALELVGEEEVTKVQTVTLDALAAQGAFDPDRVGLLWVDAENHEGQILEGALELVGRGVPVAFEWDPPGLAARGKPDSIGEIVRAHYTHFARLRAGGPGNEKYRLLPIEEFDPQGRVVGPAGEDRFTDILVLRLRPEQAQGVDLDAILHGSAEPAEPAPEPAPAEPEPPAPPAKAGKGLKATRLPKKTKSGPTRRGRG